MMATKTKTKDPVDGEVIAPPRNAVTVTPTVDKFMSELLPSKSAKDLWSGLPEHVSKELFKRNLFNALTQNGKLMDCNKALLFREISKAAALGLLLDPLLGEAYLIISRDGVPQLRVGYKGLMKLARQSGNVAGLWCHEVCENDEVEADLGHPKKYSHRPVLFGERGPVVGYTAVISYKDGTFDFEPMSLKECFDIRDRSVDWKALFADKIKSTPWYTDPGEMCKKTVFNRLMKRQDKSPEMRLALDIENEAERDPIEHAPQERLRAPEAPPSDDGDGGNQSRDLASERAKEIAKGKRTARAPAPPEETKEAIPPNVYWSDEHQNFYFGGDGENRHKGMGVPFYERWAHRRAEFPGRPVDDEPVPDIPKTAKALIEWTDEMSKNIQTPEMLEHLRDLVTPRLVGMFPPDVDAIEAIFRQTEKRIAP